VEEITMLMNRQFLSRGLPVLLLVAPLLGCASSQAPKELLDARAAYTRAESGFARELSPASLHDAKVALDGAEQTFSDDGDSQQTRDAAYIATRKAQLADTNGATEHFQRELTSSKERQGQAQAKSAVKTTQELAQTREQLASEKAGRQAAEQRSKDALTRLAAANAANVKQEDRGMVITLSGNVLFASGKSALLPGAQTSLDQVAEALKSQEDKKILIEGHTDSRGTESSNMVLSKARADSVQSYLVSRGLPQERVTSNGLGPSRPVADNNTAEGRANNRRVEIVIQATEPH
jgi:outer membrane protein OmpA-like peptidoglycan-associated protein